MNACKDCKWCEFDVLTPDKSVCKSPKRPTETDPITGDTIAAYTYCSILRDKYNFTQFCGPEAIWFEPKPEKIIIPDNLMEEIPT